MKLYVMAAPEESQGYPGLESYWRCEPHNITGEGVIRDDNGLDSAQIIHPSILLWIKLGFFFQFTSTWSRIVHTSIWLWHGLWNLRQSSDCFQLYSYRYYTNYLKAQKTNKVAFQIQLNKDICLSNSKITIRIVRIV